MAYIESYQCDVCGDKKGEGGDWWLAWVDCFQGEKPEEDQPLIKLTRWQTKHAHSAGVKHLCGARCAGTLMDRWMTQQHADPDAHCARKDASMVDLASGNAGICAGYRESDPELWRWHRWHWCNKRHAQGVPGDLRIAVGQSEQ